MHLSTQLRGSCFKSSATARSSFLRIASFQRRLILFEWGLWGPGMAQLINGLSYRPLNQSFTLSTDPYSQSPILFIFEDCCKFFFLLTRLHFLGCSFLEHAFCKCQETLIRHKYSLTFPISSVLKFLSKVFNECCKC